MRKPDTIPAAYVPSRRVRYGLTLAVAAGLALFLAPPAYRLTRGLPVLVLVPVAVVFSLVALPLLLLGFVASRRRAAAPDARRAVLGLVFVAVVLTITTMTILRARGTPPIHDVTTDTEDPPQFVAVLPARAGAANPVEYGGRDVAEQQRRSYPSVVPLHLGLPPAAAFDRALMTAREMGWDIVAADAAAGRIEATDTTLVFGFKDDVVVRIRPDGAGSRIDVRSLSRVGRGDMGTNAKRITAYLSRLDG